MHVLALAIGIAGYLLAQDANAKEQSSAPALLEMLKHADPLKRAEAATALGKLGSRAKVAVPPLKEALKDREAKVRWRVAYALWKLDPKLAEEVIAPLAEAMQQLGLEKMPDAREESAAGDAFIEVLLRLLRERLQAKEPKQKK